MVEALGLACEGAASEQPGNTGVPLAKLDEESEKALTLHDGTCLLFRQPADAGEERIFCKGNQRLKHFGFRGKVSVKRGFGDADGGSNFCRGDPRIRRFFEHLSQRFQNLLFAVNDCRVAAVGHWILLAPK